MLEMYFNFFYIKVTMNVSFYYHMTFECAFTQQLCTQAFLVFLALGISHDSKSVYEKDCI